MKDTPKAYENRLYEIEFLNRFLEQDFAGGGGRDPGGAERDLLRFAEREHVRVARRQDPLFPPHPDPLPPGERVICCGL